MKENLKIAEINMVRSQVFTNKVTDEFVMAALTNTSREEFVSGKNSGVACVDEDLPLGDGRYLMEPMVFARLLQIAEIKKTDNVLVVAAATGYPLAVISLLANRVVGVENDDKRVALIDEKMKKLKLSNVSIFNSDVKSGYAQLKPYDVIFINGAVETIPEEIIDQLKNNGRLITVKADTENSKDPAYAVLIHKVGKTVSEAKQFQAFTPRLKEFNKPKKFVF